MFFSSSGRLAAASSGVELLHRKRFAGQAGLDEEEVFAGDQAEVGGDHVAGGQFHDVAGDQVAERHLPRLAVADHGGRDADHGLELGGGVVGPRLLNEVAGPRPGPP